MKSLHRIYIRNNALRVRGRGIGEIGMSLSAARGSY